MALCSRGLEYSASQILSGWQRRINWVLFYDPSFFYPCPFSCPQVYLPRCLYLSCPSSISSSGSLQYYCPWAAGPALLFGIVLLTSKFLPIQFQSPLYLNQMRNLSLSLFKLKPQEADATEKISETGSLLSVWAPTLSQRGLSCTAVKALLAWTGCAKGTQNLQGSSLLQFVWIHTKHMQMAIFH